MPSREAALILLATTCTDALTICGPSAPAHRHFSRAHIFMQGLFDEDDESTRDPSDDVKDKFSEASMQGMASRLSGMLGLPQKDADQSLRRQSSSKPVSTTTPFIDEHFSVRPPQRSNPLDALAGVPRIEVQLVEDTEGFTLVCSGSGIDASEQVEVKIEGGVLMLGLRATREGESTPSVQFVVPVPLPEEAGSEITDAAYDGTQLTVRIDKETSRGSAHAEAGRAGEEQDDSEGAVARALRAYMRRLENGDLDNRGI